MFCCKISRQPQDLILFLGKRIEELSEVRIR
jgi:hypothetical protein